MKLELSYLATITKGMLGEKSKAVFDEKMTLSTVKHVAENIPF